MKKEDKLRYFQISLLILAAGSIYVLPYIRTNFQQAFIEVFNMDVATFSNLYVMLGMMYIIGYLPSGWLADKFSYKKLVVFSLLVTGFAGLYVATIPPSNQLFFIFLIWGISTVFTFWSALIKGVTILAKPEEQAKAFGILDGMRGLIEALLATLALVLFGSIVGVSQNIEDTTRGLQAVIIFWSSWSILIGIVIFFVLKEPKTAKNDELKESLGLQKTIQNLKIILKMPEVWLMSGVIFCGYTIFWTTYYLGGYIQTAFGLNAVVAASITTGMMWMRPLGGIGGGFLADKFSKEKVFSVALILGGAALIAISLYSGNAVIIIGFFVLFIGLMSYVLRGIYWSFLDDFKLEPEILGIAIGVISLAGYLPDILIPKLSSPIFIHYNDGKEAYMIYFIVSAIIGIVGVVVTIYFKKVVNNKMESVD